MQSDVARQTLLYWVLLLHWESEIPLSVWTLEKYILSPFGNKICKVWQQFMERKSHSKIMFNLRVLHWQLNFYCFTFSNSFTPERAMSCAACSHSENQALSGKSSVAVWNICSRISVKSHKLILNKLSDIAFRKVKTIFESHFICSVWLLLTTAFWNSSVWQTRQNYSHCHFWMQFYTWKALALTWAIIYKWNSMI